MTAQGALCKKLVDDESLVKAELPSLLFLYEALMQTDCSYLNFVLDDIRDKFGTMIAKGATSLWETVHGAEAFSRAGSLCHAWSSVFNYVAGAYVLGVKPIEPGFKKFSFDPAVGYLSYFSGEVPTPYGPIEIEVDNSSVKMKNPQEICQGSSEN